MAEYCNICKREHGKKLVNCCWCEQPIGCRQRKVLVEENTFKNWKDIISHYVYHKGCYNKMINSRKDKYLHEVD